MSEIKMAKTCKQCGKQFTTEPITVPYVATFCSHTCKCLYYTNGKETLSLIYKFIWRYFSKKNGRIQKLLNGDYSLWHIYTTYLYFLNRNNNLKKELQVDEFEFPFLFIEAIKEKKKIDLEIIAKTETENKNKFFVNRYNDPREKDLPFGEDLYYVEKDGILSKHFLNCLIDEDKCEDLKDQKEKELEKFLVDSVNKNNGICWKLAASSPGCSGAPDRVVIMPNNQVGFIEVKRPNGTSKPRKNQIEQLNKLKKNTEYVYVLDDPDKVDEILKDIEFNQHSELRYQK